MTKLTVALSTVILLLFANWTLSNEDRVFCSGFEELAPRGFGPLTWIYDDTREGETLEIAVADLNGDGFEDIITASFLFPLEDRGVPILILLSDGQGGFVDGTSELISGPIPQTIHPREIVLGDFNNDGRTDVFIADHGLDEPTNPGNQNTLLLSAVQNKLIDATGDLPQQLDFTHSATAGDIDGDGDLDLYLGNQGNPPEFVPVQIWINDSDGNFTIGENLLPSQLITDSEKAYTTSHFVDVNGDGAVDLVLGPNRSDNKVIISLNDGGGKFNSPVADAVPTFSSLGEASTAVDSQSADLDGDGRPDLLILFHSSNGQGRAIQVLINNGDGTFRDESATRLPWVEPDAHWWKYFHLVDIDGDCDVDIMTEAPGADEFTHLFLNDGSGVFNRTLEGVPEPFPHGSAFRLIDINQDGALDIVNEAGHSFWYVLNLAPACVTAPSC